MKLSSIFFSAALLFIAACSKNNNNGVTPVIPTQGASSVNTFAGSGMAGFADGTKQQASFKYPLGIAMNVSGFLFVADAQNNLIRMISPQGVVTTLAGTGKTGFSNVKDSVSFNVPSGVAADANGNIFVADQGNSAIREITPQGTVTTFAGTGTAGFANGQGKMAIFNTPAGVATDAAGNIYVADTGNNMIREITTKGIVTTFAGTGMRGSFNGIGATATFNQPQALVVDAAGNLYVADEGNNLIRKITPGGMVTTLAGNGSAGAANGTGYAASFNAPAGITVDSNGNIYVGDSKNNIIRKITPSGTVSTLAGTGPSGSDNGALNSATFSNPQGVAADPYNRIFVIDTGNNLIRLIAQ